MPQILLDAYTPDDPSKRRTTGFEISCMAAVALEFDAPEEWHDHSPPEAIRAAAIRTTEYAIRQTAPNTPSSPAADDGPSLYDLVAERLEAEHDGDTKQTTLV